MTVKRGGLPGLSGQSALSLVVLEPSSEEGHVMSPATLAEAHPFKPESAPLANVTIAVSVRISLIFIEDHPLLSVQNKINLGIQFYM